LVSSKKKNNNTDIVFENIALKRIFVHERDGETGGWRKLQTEELRNVYSSPDTVR
jgi:hypothetical protein